MSSSSEILSGKKLKAEVEAVDVQLNSLAALSGYSTPGLSLWISRDRRPREKNARRVAQTLEALKRIRAIYGDVKVDLNDLAWTRKELRKMSGERSDPIPQEWGVKFGVDWAERFGFRPEEPFTMAQFHPRVLRATIMSQPAQRWLRSVTAAIEKELGGTSFADYAAKFGDRHTAVTAIANAAFAALIDECGKEKILEYLAALVATGEIRQAPSDEN